MSKSMMALIGLCVALVAMAAIQMWQVAGLKEATSKLMRDQHVQLTAEIAGTKDGLSLAIGKKHAEVLKAIDELRSETAENRSEVAKGMSDQRAALLDELTSLKSAASKALDDQQTQMAKSMSSVERTVSNQNAVIDRAMGKIIPVVMPAEWENRLSQLEARIKEPGRWPKDASEAEGFLNQASSLVKDMPAWAEADYLPRLTPVRWAAGVFVSIARPRDDAAIPSIIEETKGLVSAIPDGGSADLERKLKEESRLLSEKLDQSKLAEAIKTAGQYIQNANSSSSDEALADISNVYDVLGLYEEEGPQAAEVRALRTQLHKSMVESQGKQQAASLAERWSIVQKLRNDQPGIFEMSVNMLLQEVATTRVALALERVKQPTLDDLETALRHVITETSTQAAKREEERQAKAIREYQRWALGQIRKFEGRMSKDSLNRVSWDAVQRVKDGGGCQGLEDLPSVADAISHAKYTPVKGKFWGSTSVYTWQDKPYTEPDFASELWFKVLRDVFVADLLPVNPVLLETAVQERYQRAFLSGLKLLDGRDDQTYVAEQTALAIKKPLRDFIEGQP